jgi:penicillin-binding protein 2
MAGKLAVFRARSTRIKYILYGFLFFLFILIVRLFYLQVDKRVALADMCTKNFLRIEIIPPLRGDVYDCNQVLLAANRPVFDLYWYGSGSVLSDHDMQILVQIEHILDIDLLQPPKRSSIEYASRYARKILLKSDVNFQQLCQISEQCADARSLMVSHRFQRMYPHKELACHVLGYLNRGENIGQSGVELKFESALQGQEGRLLQVINSTGKMLSQRIYKEPRAGDDLNLTLDFKLQQLAESLFEGEQAGAFILMDPTNGALRALVSYPRFDPNVFLNPLSEEEWSNITMNNPLLNRATCALYPPASTFKLVTWAAGIEERIVGHDTEIFCNGYVTFCGRKYFCMHHLGHGALNPKQALAVSCNIPCFHIARKLKIDQLARYASRFGLGQTTHFLLPEKSGLVPTRAWKQHVKGERWWKGETLSAGIGQGYLLVTPLQVARMLGSICTGYLVKPRLIESEPIEKQKLELSFSTISFLRSALKEAVVDGTCRVLGRVCSCDVYAKTGTAQTCSLTREKVNKQDLEHAWVAGYFSYREQKPLTIIVLLEHAGSSHYALEIAHKFLRGYVTLMQQQETQTEQHETQ